MRRDFIFAVAIFLAETAALSTIGIIVVLGVLDLVRFMQEKGW